MQSEEDPWSPEVINLKAFGDTRGVKIAAVY